ncbi:MAG: T9SS type A sorting domain-containing protein [Tenacibaculum sp.]|nr:T9SS type A sorting domain-containing protein [Tenacibaculum sp.]
MKQITILFSLFVLITTLNAQSEFQKNIVIDGFSSDKPELIESADLDGDNDLDFVFYSVTDRKISWFENLDGKGQTEAQKVISENRVFQVSEMRIVDFDKDGDNDIVINTNDVYGDNETPILVWYENLDGKGDFSLEQTILKTENGEWYTIDAFEFGDIDKDNDLDLIVSLSNKKIFWYQNTNGNGSFGEPILVSSNIEISQLFVLDMNNDTNNDILFFSRSEAELGFFNNYEGNGNFIRQNYTFSDGNEKKIRYLYPADIDGDSYVDLVVKDEIEGTHISWYKNFENNNNFTSKKKIASASTSATTSFIIAKDINGDTYTDVVSVEPVFGGFAKTKIRWHKNDGLGNFNETFQTSTEFQKSISDISIGDFNGDDNVDIIAAFFDESIITWYKNENNEGNFSLGDNLTTRINYNSFSISLDFDKDGDIDLFTHNVWFENVNANFTPRETNLPCTFQYRQAFADIDRDGDKDYVAIDESPNYSSDLVWFKNLNGRGEYSERIVIAKSDDIENAKAIAVGDVDDDGDQDIVATYKGSGSISNQKLVWFENTDGQGTFTSQKVLRDNYLFENNPIHILDVDGDDDNDIVFIGSSKILWLEKVAVDGYFSSVTKVLESQDGRRVRFFDLNGDGLKDLIYTYHTSLVKVVWKKNEGNGVFSERKTITPNYNNYLYFDLGDFDDDGDLDVIYTVSDSRIIAIKENKGTGSFETSLTFVDENIKDPSYLTMTDINGDGDLDILVSFHFGQLTWYENKRKSLSVFDETNNTNYRIYPNPIKDILHINNLNSQEIKVFVYTLNGRLILEKNFSNLNKNIELDLSILKTSLYAIKAIGNNDNLNFKILKK